MKTNLNQLLMSLELRIEYFLYIYKVEGYYADKLINIQKQIEELRKFNKDKKGEIKWNVQNVNLII